MDSEGFPYQYDATLVGAEGDPEQTVVDRPRMKNRFAVECVVPQERTVVWSREEQIDLNRVAARLASYGGSLSARARCFAAIGIAAVLSVGIVAATMKENRPTDMSGDLMVSFPTPEPRFASTTLSSPAMGKPSAVNSVPVVDSNMAADALVDGRLEQAMAYFRALKERHPESEPYGLIVDILAASLEMGAP